MKLMPLLPATASGNRDTSTAPVWFQITCTSTECAGRTVETIRCATESEAERIWGDRLAPGEDSIEVHLCAFQRRSKTSYALD
jgi:hypothetical protein